MKRAYLQLHLDLHPERGLFTKGGRRHSFRPQLELKRSSHRKGRLLFPLTRELWGGKPGVKAARRAAHCSLQSTGFSAEFLHSRIKVSKLVAVPLQFYGSSLADKGLSTPALQPQAHHD